MQEKSIKKSPIKGRILQYLEKEGVSKYAFYQKTGISKGTLDNDSGLTEENLMRVIDYAPQLSLKWLIQGTTPIDRDDNSYTNKVDEGDISYNVVGRDKHVAGRLLPLIPTEAFAGMDVNEPVSISEQDIQERYVVPEFRDADFMIRVKGNSMYPKYNSGDVVACTMIKGTFYQWNKVHVIATREQGVLIKRIHQGSTPELLVAVSDNKDYPPFNIPIDEVLNIALVVGVIRLE